ncbi:Serpentine Receptor, class D (delta) [Caenorhabditis elegans]|uniref:Serpentine Receptor, class D (Delta) n=1 Tax=Caenorhabditis elegans TaxID=6239 RepID=Q21716_CAEEL|nr:Serpentine Receptor, class D (delta) [Caenorhabditis elegans]CAA94166.2 Serpentine Receptor, class D (delta) [Caenorhabditis elegans]|eukprot:NP_001309447.1 Serpentine Receptor, class D (delta) [Caenorhabditis elegans]
MLTNEDYLSFLSLFNPVFFCTSVILQTIWLLFIIFHSAKMGIFRFIIAHTSVCNIACLCLVVLFQFRQVSSNVPVEVRSYGPLRILSTLTMYTCHQIFQLTILLSGISLIVTLYFKLMTLRWTKVSSITMILTFLAFHIPFFLSTGFVIYLILTVAYPQEIQEELALKNANATEYSIVGLMKLQTVSLMQFALVVGGVVLSPFICFGIRARILNLLNKHLDASSRTKTQHKSFVLGLTIQSAIPTFTYFPMYCMYFYCVTTKTEILFQQYFIYLASALPVFIEPIVTLYFVIPYRKKLLSCLGKRDNSVGTTISVSSGITRSRI